MHSYFLGTQGIEHQVGGHQLREGSGLQGGIDFLSRQNLVGRDIHQQVGARSNFWGLGRLRCRRKAHSSEESGKYGFHEEVKVSSATQRESAGEIQKNEGSN
jgi:hypothetical protein